jgi:hypothetical protein
MLLLMAAPDENASSNCVVQEQAAAAVLLRAVARESGYTKLKAAAYPTITLDHFVHHVLAARR